MSRVEQTAGKVAIVIYTNGHPLWPEITVKANNGEDVTVRTDMATLHDLRYCIDRILRQTRP